MIPWMLTSLAALAGTPDLTLHQEQGVSVRVPDGWKVQVAPDAKRVTMSVGAANSINLFWFEGEPLAPVDALLDILLNSTADALPVGTATEDYREPVPGVPTHLGPLAAKRMHATYSLLWYEMELGLVVFNDADTYRITTAFLVATPEAWNEAGGLELVTEVARSLALDADPALPAPPWSFHARPPAWLTLPPAPPSE